MDNFVKPLVIAFLCLAVLSGCAKKEPPPPPASKKEEPVTLTIGLIPEQNIFRQLERYQPLAGYLSGKTDARVKLKVLPRYQNIIENFRSLGLDGAFFGSFTYALAHNKLGVEVLARPVALDNTSTYFGLIFVRRDSGIRNLKGMKGKRFVFVDKATTAGYLLPLNYFYEGGVDDYRSYFKESYFAGTHEDSIYDVVNRKADIGAAKNTIFERLAREDERVAKELVVLATSPHVPENGLALRGDIDPSLANRLKDSLLHMHEDPEGREVLKQFGALGFIETKDEDYKPVYRYAREIHLDLSTYDYKND